MLRFSPGVLTLFSRGTLAYKPLGRLAPYRDGVPQNRERERPCAWRRIRRQLQRLLAGGGGRGTPAAASRRSRVT
jgi:hypothetical protein